MPNNPPLASATSLALDFHEVLMSSAFFSSGLNETIVCYDLFYRPAPETGGFCIMAGLEQIVKNILNFKLSASDLEWLKDKGLSADFLKYLESFKFSCDIYSVPEGTPVFPGEPIMMIKGPASQAKLIESLIISAVGKQMLIATKANRMARAAHGRKVIECGAKRENGLEASLYAARAAYIGGCSGTTFTAAAKEFSIPLYGSMTNSWIQMFDTELDAFCAYARAYPDDCVLLIDTYDVLNSGIKNAIEAFRREIVPRGSRPKGVRIDSGDLAYLSKKVRRILNDEGFPDCDIIVSNSLDEHIIKDMLQNGARVDCFMAGSRLVSSSSAPILPLVYKLVAVEDNGRLIPKIKISENVSKITNPGAKTFWRFFDRETGKALADVLALEHEIINDDEPYELFDPDFVWKRKNVQDFVARKMLVQVFSKGELVYSLPTASEIRAYCADQIDCLWEEVLRFENPHKYYVDLSQKLWDLKQSLISKYSGVKYGSAKGGEA
ncbi:MAG: nicotinate phosphoribosyltransferase [Clostridiales bacterium]|jgi:nicotinate phosphoribosyltransferase|nr:nicotinate phosphoribosyltransferase [Clostridiales bacterium]